MSRGGILPTEPTVRGWLRGYRMQPLAGRFSAIGFDTGNEESALLARGFQYGTAPGALVIGWNGHHTAVTLPDGTSVSSGEGGGVKVGGGGAYQAQFSPRMFLPMALEKVEDDSAPVNVPVVVDAVNAEVPAPAPD